MLARSFLSVICYINNIGEREALTECKIAKSSAWCVSLANFAFVFSMFEQRAIKGLRTSVHPLSVFTLVLLLLLVGFNGILRTCEGADITIFGFVACDVTGSPLDYFPKMTTAYFNISVRNLMQNPRNISLYVSVYDELDVPVGSDSLDTTAPVNSSTYVLSVYIPKWAFVGVATAYASLLVGGAPVDSETTGFYIGPVDLTPPVIRIVSPENVTYQTESVLLIFTVNERTPIKSYSLNNLSNVSIAKNTSLTRLADGLYRLVVYAEDTSGNLGSAEVYFTIAAIHDVAVFDLSCCPAKLFVGQAVNITVSIENEGTATESFNVITFANFTVIETVNVTDLSPETQITLEMIWNTAGLVIGNYTIETQIEPIHGETDVEDNVLTDVVNLISRPDIVVTKIVSSKTCVGQGFSASISVTIRNEGDYTETFDVIAYVNGITMLTFDNVTLTSKNSTTLLFNWNTASYAKGNYLLSAYVLPLPDETNTANNRLFDGTIYVGIPGDIAPAYGQVDLKDVGVVLKAFSSVPGQPTWNPNADINSDGKIDMIDVGIVIQHFGKTA